MSLKKPQVCEGMMVVVVEVVRNVMIDLFCRQLWRGGYWAVYWCLMLVRGNSRGLPRGAVLAGV